MGTYIEANSQPTIKATHRSQHDEEQTDNHFGDNSTIPKVDMNMETTAQITSTIEQPITMITNIYPL